MVGHNEGVIDTIMDVGLTVETGVSWCNALSDNLSGCSVFPDFYQRPSSLFGAVSPVSFGVYTYINGVPEQRRRARL